MPAYNPTATTAAIATAIPSPNLSASQCLRCERYSGSSRCARRRFQLGWCQASARHKRCRVVKRAQSNTRRRHDSRVYLTHMRCSCLLRQFLGLAAAATVRSVGYSEIMRLWKRDFDVVVKMFPML
eukprot:5720523-Prymnesium_polylepis.2